MSEERPNRASVCNIPSEPDYSDVTIVELSPQPTPADYLEAMEIANSEADQQLGQHMLLSWYDRDRDFESPQHTSECHSNSPIPGYIDYALYRDANLKVDIEEGRFVFFYLQVDM